MHGVQVACEVKEVARLVSGAARPRLASALQPRPLLPVVERALVKKARFEAPAVLHQVLLKECCNREAIRAAWCAVPSARLVPRAAPLQPVGQTLLERVSVTLGTATDYENRIERLKAFGIENNYGGSCFAELEELTPAYMNWMFLEGASFGEGTKLWSALRWRHPELSSHGTEKMPRVSQALQGWKKGRPPLLREPMAWIEAYGVASEMVRQGCWMGAALLLIMFDCYLRPGEAYDLRVVDAAPPVAAGGYATRNWALTVRSRDLMRPTKTGAFDDAVVIDNPRRKFLGEILAALVLRRRKNDLSFGQDAREFTNTFQRACASLGLELVPYQARHGGASGDRADEFRTLEQIRKHGRWQSEFSTRRYEKAGKLQGKLAAMDPRMLEFLADSAEHVRDVMLLRRPPRLPPAHCRRPLRPAR